MTDMTLITTLVTDLAEKSHVLTVLAIFALPFIIWLLVLIDILKHDFKGQNTKLVWLLAVIFLPFLGFILYLLIGRSQRLNRI